MSERASDGLRGGGSIENVLLVAKKGGSQCAQETTNFDAHCRALTSGGSLLLLMRARKQEKGWHERALERASERAKHQQRLLPIGQEKKTIARSIRRQSPLARTQFFPSALT